MKRLTLLFLLLMLAGITNNLKGQTFFEDSTVYYSFDAFPSVSPPISAFIVGYNENIYFDSISSGVEFYTVIKVIPNNPVTSVDTIIYNLIVDSNKVYYNNLLLYDLSLKIGDTMKIDYMNIIMVVDSIKMKTFEDGKERETHYLNVIKGGIYLEQKLFFARGFGFSNGLICFSDIFYFVRTKDLLTVCKGNNDLVYFNEYYWNMYFDSSVYCDEANILSLRDSIQKSSIDEIIKNAIKIFPNPATQTIYISGFENSEYFIYNQLGDIVLEGVLSDKINIENLAEGVYILKLVDEKGVISNKFIKQ